MPPPGTLEERGPRGFRGGRRRPRRSQRRSHCGPLWLGEAEEEPGLATAPSWKGVLGRGTALRRWEAGPRMGGRGELPAVQLVGNGGPFFWALRRAQLRRLPPFCLCSPYLKAPAQLPSGSLPWFL